MKPKFKLNQIVYSLDAERYYAHRIKGFIMEAAKVKYILGDPDGDSNECNCCGSIFFSEDSIFESQDEFMQAIRTEIEKELKEFESKEVDEP